MLRLNRHSRQSLLSLVFFTSLLAGCGASATVRVGAGASGSTARATVDATGLLGAVAALLERGAEGGQESSGQGAGTGREQRGAASRPSMGANGPGAITQQTAAGLAEMPDFAALDSGAASDSGATSPSTAAGALRSSGAAAEGGRGWGASIPAGTALIELIGRGVLVDGVLVRLADLGPLSSYGAGGGWRGAADVGRQTIALVDRGPLQAQVELVPLGGGSSEADLVVGLRGVASGAPPRGRNRVHLVLDRSQSMAAIWPEVIGAARGLVGALQPWDVIHVVAYGSSAVEVLAPTAVGDGRAALEALEALELGGYTNLEAGLELAYAGVRRANAESRGDNVLVLLVSDGVPNVGAFGPTAVGLVAAGARRELGCTTSVVGLGTEFDAAVLTAISREGRGGYHVARTAADLLPILEGEVGARERVALRDLELSLTMAPGVEALSLSDGQAGAVRDGGALTLTLPALHVEEERQLVVRLDLGAWTSGAEVVTARLGFEQSGAGRQTFEATLRGGPPRSPSTGAALILADAGLSVALEEAAAALRGDDGPRAAEALRAHGRTLRAFPGLPAVLERRTARVDFVASALERLGSGAPSEDRTQVARALGELSISLGR